MRRTCVIGAVLAIATAHARGGGLVVTGGSARSIGRAGAGTVGDDGAGALLVNPAALARRDGIRAQLGVALVDDEIAWEPQSGPIARNQSPSSAAPTFAAIGGIGGWIIGLGAMTAAVSERSLIRLPGTLPSQGIGNRFEFRYAGIAGSLRRDAVTIGAARRIGDTLALGVSVSGARVTMSETRRVWAGFGGRDIIGAPERDVEISLSGHDRFVPGVLAGVLIAPEAMPLELGASIGWSPRVRIGGDVEGSVAPGGPTVQRTRASSAIDLQHPLAMRAGVRYLSDRFVLELGGDLWAYRRSAERIEWHVYGMSVIDSSGLEVPLSRVPSRLSQRTHGALRAAADVELLSGFLWATAGYAYASSPVRGSRQSPTFGDLGGHTLAFGLEASAGGFTLTAGWSRTWAVTSAPASELSLDNPFRAGDRTVAPGSYDGSVDQIGILIDAELDAPR